MLNNHVLIRVNMGLDTIHPYVSVFIYTFWSTCGLKVYEKMHEKLSGPDISGGGIPLPDESKIDALNFCDILNFIDTWLKVIYYIYSCCCVTHKYNMW